MLGTVCSSYLQKPKGRLQSTCPRNAYTDCRDLNWEKDNTCRIHIFMCAVLSLQAIIVFLQMIVQVMIQPAVMHLCPSHEDGTSDELLSSYRLKSRNLVVKTTRTTVLHINISVRPWCLLCRAVAPPALCQCLLLKALRVRKLLALHRRSIKYL